MGSRIASASGYPGGYAELATHYNLLCFEVKYQIDTELIHILTTYSQNQLILKRRAH